MVRCLANRPDGPCRYCSDLIEMGPLIPVWSSVVQGSTFSYTAGWYCTTARRKDRRAEGKGRDRMQKGTWWHRYELHQERDRTTMETSLSPDPSHEALAALHMFG
jgi:hypothetical protein